MTSTVFQYQDIVLQGLKNQAVPFYLAGGTALAKFYFQHRDSYDLDFFSQDYTPSRVRAVIGLIEKATGKKVRLIRRSAREGMAQMASYDLALGKKEFLKIDFVEDVLPLLKPLKRVDGIEILSLDDIYLRKIHAVSGTLPEADKVGARRFSGGRTEAKDFYDLYQLSSTYRRLSSFVNKFAEPVQREALIHWYHTYSRQAIKIGLMELAARTPVEFAAVERHFKKEISYLIGGMV